MSGIVLPPNTVVREFAASGSFIVPSTAVSILADIWGAGGGGALAHSAGGGGGGSFVSKLVSANHLAGKTLTVNIGAGGIGATTGQSSGSNGGSTNIDEIWWLYAPGGTGGEGNLGGYSVVGGAGGVPSTYPYHGIQNYRSGNAGAGANSDGTVLTPVDGDFAGSGGGAARSGAISAGAVSSMMDVAFPIGGNGGDGSNTGSGGDGGFPAGGGGASYYQADGRRGGNGADGFARITIFLR